MEINLKVILKMIWFKVVENISEQMEDLTKEIGKMDFKMVKELKFGQMEIDTKGIMCRAKRTVTEYTIGPMDQNTKVNGKMGW